MRCRFLTILMSSESIVRSVIFIIFAFIFCFVFADNIYDFLSVPIRKRSEAERRELPVAGRTGEERILPLSSLKIGDSGRYVFDRATTLGQAWSSPELPCGAVVGQNAEGKIGLFTDEPIIPLTRSFRRAYLAGRSARMRFPRPLPMNG